MSTVSEEPPIRRGDRLQLARLRGHVDADDMRAVAGEHGRDRLADATRRAGHERDLAGQRALPVDLARLRRRARRRGPSDPTRMPTSATARTGASSRSRSPPPARRTRAARVAPLLDLLADRAHEPVERPLRARLARVLGTRPAGCRARSRARRSGCAGSSVRRTPTPRAAASRQPIPVASNTSALNVCSSAPEASATNSSARSRRARGRRLASSLPEPRAAAEQHRAVDHRLAGLVALEPDRRRQADLLGHDPPDGRVHQLRVTVTHRTQPP